MRTATWAWAFCSALACCSVCPAAATRKR
jgi:hypothetical protein